MNYDDCIVLTTWEYLFHRVFILQKGMKLKMSKVGQHGPVVTLGNHHHQQLIASFLFFMCSFVHQKHKVQVALTAEEHHVRL